MKKLFICILFLMTFSIVGCGDKSDTQNYRLGNEEKTFVNEHSTMIVSWCYNKHDENRSIKVTEYYVDNEGNEYICFTGAEEDYVLKNSASGSYSDVKDTVEYTGIPGTSVNLDFDTISEYLSNYTPENWKFS